VGVDVSGHDYKSQKVNHFNYYTMLSRTSSLMIRQNSILMAKLMKPDILVDIQMARYGGFDYDKSEKFVTIGRLKTSLAISKYEHNV
jgi:NTE family protein